MGYLKGSGTVDNPYIIHDALAVESFFGQTEPCWRTAAYFHVVNDIDASGIVVPGFTSSIAYTAFKAILYGNGCQISNFTISGDYSWGFGNGGSSGELYDIHLKFNGAKYGAIGANSSKFKVIKNCRIECITGKFAYSWLTLANAQNVLIEYNDIHNAAGYPGVVYSLSDVPITNAYSGVTLLVGQSRFSPENYPTLSSDEWIIDGASIPRLIKQSTAWLTTIYAVKGVTKVGGQPKSRVCSAHYPLDFYQISSVTSHAGDGSYLLNCGAYSDHVYVTHRDSYGLQLRADTTYAAGDLIHPKTANGYRYRCSTAGTTDSVVPDALPLSGSIPLGTALFTPEPIYQAETFLVVPRLYSLITGQPV